MHARRLSLIAVTMMSCLLLWGGVSCKKPETDESAKKKGPPPCPTTFDANQHTDGLTCICPKGRDHGKVWGTNLYMTGSATCTAAIHAGVITKTKGGKIDVKYNGGCNGYKGSTKNGVSTKFWSGNSASFHFAGHGTGQCDE